MKPVAILCLLATTAFGFKDKGFNVRYGMDANDIGKTTFVDLPQNRTAAINRSWENMPRPDGPAGYASLDLWCPKYNYTYCLLYDNTGYIAGVQIAVNSSKISDNVYDWAVSGYSNWTVTVDDVSTLFYATQQYYVTTDHLSIPAATRLAQRNESVLLQSDIVLTGFNGDLITVSTNVSQLENELFTKQGCFPGMGIHYYYNMTTSLQCTAETVLSYFLLVADCQIVGIGYSVIGQYALESDENDPFEHPNEAIIKINVPYAPQCIYDYVNDQGWLTMHVFFVDKAYNIICNTTTSTC